VIPNVVALVIATITTVATLVLRRGAISATK
jgi:hypothetical protein